MPPMHSPIILSAPLQNQGEPADLSFLAYLDIWLISGLVLLAVVVVVGKWLWGRFRRPPGDDAYDYYEDETYYTDDDRYSGNR